MATDNVIQVVLKLRNEFRAAFSQVRSDINGVKANFEELANADFGKAAKDLQGLAEAVKEGKEEFNSLKGSMDQSAETLKKLYGVVGLVTKAFAAWKSLGLVSDLAQTAARSQVLETVLFTVGTNANLSTAALVKMDKAVQSMGITSASSRQSLIQLIQAGLVTAETTERASRLARAAQDLAVVSGENSSDTLQRLITNIQQMDTIGLRNMGILISQDAAQAKYAITLGKTAAELSAAEKQTAVYNAVMEEAAKLTGTYEASMGDAAKQASSMSRFVTTLKENLGKALLPAYLAVAEGSNKILEALGAGAQEMNKQGQAAQALGNVINSLLDGVLIAVKLLVELKSVVIALAVAFALLKVPAAFGAIFSIVGLTGIQLQTMGFTLTRLIASFEAVKLSGVGAFGAIQIAAASAGAVIRLFFGWLTVAIALFEVGKFLYSFKAIQQVADLVFGDILALIELVGAGLLRMFRPLIVVFEGIRGFVNGGFKGAAQAIDEILPKIDAMQAKLSGTGDKFRKNFEAFQGSKTQSVVDDATEMVKKLNEAELAFNALEKEYAQVQKAVAKGNPEAAVRLAQLDKEIASAKDRKKALNKDYQEFLKTLDAEGKQQAKQVRFDLTAQVNEVDIRAKIASAKDEIQQSITTLGLDKLSIGLDGTALSNEFSSAEKAFGKLVERFNKPILRNGKIDADSAIVSVNQLTQGFLKLSEAAKSPEELARAVSQLDKLMESLNARGEEVGETYANLRSSLTFKQQELDVKAVTGLVEGYTGRLRQLWASLQLVRSVQDSLATSDREYQRTLVELGFTSEDSGRSLEELSRKIELASKSTKQLSALDLGDLTSSFNKLKTDYAADVAAFDAALQAKVKALGDYKGSEDDKRRQTQSLEKASIEERIQISKKYFDSLQSLQRDALSKFKSYADQVKAIENEIADTERSRDKDIRDIRRGLMTEQQRFRDTESQLAELAARAESERLRGNFDEAKRLYKERIDLTRELAKDESLTDRQRKDFLGETEEAYRRLNEVQQSQKTEAEDAAAEQARMYQQITSDLQNAAEAISTLSQTQIVELSLEINENSLQAIQAKLKTTFGTEGIPVIPKVEFPDVVEAKNKLELGLQQDPPVLPVSIQPKVDRESLSTQLTELTKSGVLEMGASLKLLLDENSLTKAREAIAASLGSIRVVVKVVTEATSSIAAFAGGGKIRGPGTSTSDSILLWGSNGEFMLNAKAVSTYGESFISDLNQLRISPYDIPGFASGGPIPGPTPQPLAGAPSFGKRDVVDFNLTIGGKKVTLMGERAQVKRTIEVLKDIGE